MNILKIETITAFVGTDELGNEGLIGFKGPQGWVPMVCADEDRVKQLFPIAETMSEVTGKSFRVIRFDSQTDVTEEMTTKYSSNG